MGGEKVLSVSKAMSIVSEVSSFVGIGLKVLNEVDHNGFEPSSNSYFKDSSSCARCDQCDGEVQLVDESAQENARRENKKSYKKTKRNSSNAFSVLLFLYILVLFL